MAGLWLIICALFVLAEIFYSGFFLIWFAAGAVAALLISFFIENVILQFLVFIIVSLTLLLTLTKKLSVHFNKQNSTPTNVDKLIGKTALVTEDINQTPLNPGLAKLDGEFWTAISSNGELIKKNTLVIIKDIKGVRLIVEPISQKEN